VLGCKENILWCPNEIVQIGALNCLAFAAAFVRKIDFFSKLLDTTKRPEELLLLLLLLLLHIAKRFTELEKATKTQGPLGKKRGF
jgi:uncharacterized membrane protein